VLRVLHGHLVDGAGDALEGVVGVGREVGVGEGDLRDDGQEEDRQQQVGDEVGAEAVDVPADELDHGRRLLGYDVGRRGRLAAVRLLTTWISRAVSSPDCGGAPPLPLPAPPPFLPPLPFLGTAAAAAFSLSSFSRASCMLLRGCGNGCCCSDIARPAPFSLIL
jgi:hypothetical protein